MVWVVEDMIQKEVLPAYRGALSPLKRRQKTISFHKGQFIQEGLLLLFCFFIGRAVLFGQSVPFGIALFAVLLHKKMGAFSAFMAVSAGLLSAMVWPVAVKYIAAMALIASAMLLLEKRSAGGLLRPAVLVFGALAGLNLLDAALNHFLLYRLLAGAFESFTAFLMVFVFAKAADVMKDTRRRRILSTEEIICFSILLSVMVLGIRSEGVFGLSLRNISAVFLILLFSAIGGAGIGASMGITVGFVLSLAGAPNPVLIANLAVCGLMGGTFKGLGRAGTAFAFLLANGLMTFYINQSTYVILPFWEIAAASALILLCPVKALDSLKQYLDYSAARSREQQYYVKRMQELTAGRLKEFSQVFCHLAKVFGRISERKSAVGQDELSKLFDLVAEQVCKACAMHRACWQRDFYTTYSHLFDMLAACEAKGAIDTSDMPVELQKRCLSPARLTEAMNAIYAVYKTNLHWQQRMDDCRQLVAEQLEGIGQVVTQLAAEINMDIRFKKDIEDSVHLALDREGIRVREVLVLEKAGGSMEVSIAKDPCQGNRECIRKVERIVSASMNRPMHTRLACRHGGKSHCVLQFTAARQFEVMAGVARQAKGSNRICGDNYAFAPIQDGKYLLALSDGMGAGARAAEESGAVISLLENFLEAGFTQDITIRTINSILMLRSREEIFATADLCVLDLVEGMADFVKIGGVASFLKRDGKARIIRESTLPIGILEEVASEPISLSIQDEDMLIMATDGILDAFTGPMHPEQAFSEVFEALLSSNPQETAEVLLAHALALKGGEAADDMTVMAVRIWKPYS